MIAHELISYVGVSRFLQTLFVSMTILATPVASLSQDKPIAQSKSSIGAIGRMIFIVDKIMPDSVAEKSGLSIGDLIVKVHGRQFESIDDFEQLSRKAMTPGSTIQVLRLNTDDFINQQIQTINLFISPSPNLALGVIGRVIFMIERVLENGPASKAGFRQGDLIEKVNGVSTSTIQQFKNMGLNDPGTEVRLRVLRPDARKLTPYTIALRTMAVSELVIR